MAGDGEETEGVGLQQYVVSVCQGDCKQTAEKRKKERHERVWEFLLHISSSNIQSILPNSYQTHTVGLGDITVIIKKHC